MNSHVNDTMGNPEHKVWFSLALLLWFLAIPLRLIFFSGYSLGDDPNYLLTPLYFLDTGGVNFDNHHTNRLAMFLGQIVSYSLFPINDYTFVLPIFLSSLGIHGTLLFIAKSLFHSRMAFLVSLWMLVTPFETLASTSFAPDYIVSFFSLLAVWGLIKGFQSEERIVLLFSGCSMGIAVLTKLSAILIFPSLAIAGLLSIRWIENWHGKWLWFFVGFFCIISIVSFIYLNLHGDPLHWFKHRAIPPEGHDVTYKLFDVLMVYPKYIYFLDDYGNWMFGLTGWLGLIGVVCGFFWLKTIENRLAIIVVLLGFLYLLVLNFLPHKIDFTAYYSHPRIFRYLPLVTPYIYLAAGLATEFLFRFNRLKKISLGIVLVTVAFAIYQTPIVSEPSWSQNSDGRQLSQYFRDNPLPKGSLIYADYWNCTRLKGLNYPESKDWRINCATPHTRKEKTEFLDSIQDGYVITGGGSLAWYSPKTWVLDISRSDFNPNHRWKLLYEISGDVKPWRTETMKIWRVTDPTLDDSLFDPDDVVSKEWEECLRKKVFPLRKEDGVAIYTVLTRRQASFVTQIECLDMNIQDVTGIDRFPNLKILNLSNNALRKIDISGALNLEMLLLANNQITQIIGLQTTKNLRFLWAASNSLTHVSIPELKDLRDLRLDNNNLESIEGIQSLPQLEELFLNRNPNLDCVAAKIPEKWLIDGRCD